jgi:hypothetical protein
MVKTVLRFVQLDFMHRVHCKHANLVQLTVKIVNYQHAITAKLAFTCIQTSAILLVLWEPTLV